METSINDVVSGFDCACLCFDCELIKAIKKTEQLLFSIVVTTTLSSTA